MMAQDPPVSYICFDDLEPREGELLAQIQGIPNAQIDIPTIAEECGRIADALEDIARSLSAGQDRWPCCGRPLISAHAHDCETRDENPAK